MTNLLLFLGLLVPLRPLLVPWLVAHSVLVLALTAASVNYLVLYSYVDCRGDCTVLLGLSISLVVAIVTILYCIYVVQDYFDILKYEQAGVHSYFQLRGRSNIAEACHDKYVTPHPSLRKHNIWHTAKQTVPSS